jgi:two-component system response regulator YesN
MLNGLEVMQIIKEEKIRSKVIIISGHDEFNYALQAIELGVHSFILKPVNKIKLLRALNEIRELINQEKNISIELDHSRSASAKISRCFAINCCICFYMAIAT